MQTLRAILYWLDGKKLHIANVVTITTGFLSAKGVIDADTAAFIIAITGALTSTAQGLTVSLGANRKYNK